MDEQTFVFAALASWRGVKGTPKEASKGMLKFDANHLFDMRRHEPVAWPVGKGKRRVIVIKENAGRRYGSWGRSSGNIADYVKAAIVPKLDGPYLMLGYRADNELTDSPRWERVATALAGDNCFAEAYALATAIRMPVSKLPRPAYKYDLDPSGRWYGAGIREAKTRDAVDAFDPIKVKAKAKAKREENKRIEEERVKAHRERLRLQPYYSARDIAQGALRNLENDGQRLTGEEILAYYGHTPKPGEWFKILGSDRMARHGAWPAIGEWSQPVDRVRVCASGWHLTPVDGIPNWLSWGAELYLAEGKGYSNGDSDKAAFASARLVKHIGRVDREAQECIINARNTGERKAIIEAARVVCAEASFMLAMAVQGYC